MTSRTVAPAPPATESARPQVRTPSLASVVGAIVVMIGAYIGAAPLSDNSFFTHLATGRYILEHGIPRHDVYSFTARDEPWVVQSWLASLLYGLVDRIAGLVGLRVLTAVLAGVTAGLLWMLTRPARGLVVRLAVAVVGLTIAATMWSPRPLLLGLLFLGLALLVVERRWVPWVLVPIFWFWVNTHGSFPLGLLAIGCYALGSRLDGERRPSELRPLAFAAGGTLLGALNPLGPVLLTFPLNLLGRQDAIAAVVEWQSPKFSSVYARAFLVLVALSVVALVRRPAWRSAVPFVVFLALALTAARNIPVAAFVFVPGIACGLRGLGALDGRERGRLVTGLFAVTVAIGLVAVGGRLAGSDLSLDEYPVDAVAWLDQEGLLGGETPMAHPDVVGNYLELLRGEDASVFSDDRVDMYPQAVIDDELALIRGSARWRKALDGVDVVLWERSSPIAQILVEDPAWRLTYSDQAWVVYQRLGT